MIRRLQQALAVLMVLFTTVALSTTAANAAPSRTTLQNAASRVTYEDQGGPAYAYYKKKYPTQLNWTNDGCSVPVALIVAISPLGGAAAAYYKSVFKHSCDRHDFGYRNYGKNTSTPGPHPKFDPDQYRKDTIDKRFYANMKIQCGKKFGAWYQAAAKAACNAAAKVFYKAVNTTSFGHKAFFG